MLHQKLLLMLGCWRNTMGWRPKGPTQHTYQARNLDISSTSNITHQTSYCSHTPRHWCASSPNYTKIQSADI